MKHTDARIHVFSPTVWPCLFCHVKIQTDTVMGSGKGWHSKKTWSNSKNVCFFTFDIKNELHFDDPGQTVRGHLFCCCVHLRSPVLRTSSLIYATVCVAEKNTRVLIIIKMVFMSEVFLFSSHGEKPKWLTICTLYFNTSCDHDGLRAISIFHLKNVYGFIVILSRYAT